MDDSPLATTDPARSIYGDPNRSYLNPSSLFVDSNYRLRINAWSSAAGVTLACRYRFLRANDNELVDSAEQLAVTNNRVITTTDFALPVGFLIDLNVFALAGTPAYGTTFFTVQLIRGAGVAATVVAQLLQAYIAANVAKAWPGSALENPLDGPGVLRSITGTNPGAGNNISEAVPAGARWEPLGFRYQFVTSAVVANRISSLIFDDGVNLPFACAGGVSTQAASTTNVYFFGQSQQHAAGASNAISDGFGDNMRLAAAARLRTQTAAIDVGDVYSQIQYLVREWLTAD